MASEIVATALEQLAYLLREYPMQSGILAKVLIGNNGGMAPEITIQFSVQEYAKKVKPIEVEITLWRSANNAETLILDAFSTKDGEGLLHEVIDLKHLDDAYPYFEKALDLFSLEETE